jgi:hypothetical protein
MCTIGVLRFPNGAYALFKNKDFARTRFDDRLIVESEVFGVAGLATFAESDPSVDVFSGFSIGANASGLLCCDANVRMVPGHADYDDLVEIALREGTDVGSAIDAVKAVVKRTAYDWANLVMIDGSQSAVVEVRGNRTHVSQHREPITRTNHHVDLGATPDDDNTTSSLPRLDAASTAVRTIDSIDGIRDLLRSHGDGDASICVHGMHQTVYSYVLERRSGDTVLSVVQGPPCRFGASMTATVPVGDGWSSERADAFREAYPSAREPAGT